MKNCTQFCLLLLLLGLTNQLFAHTDPPPTDNPGGPLTITMSCPPNTTLYVGPNICTVPFTYDVTATDTDPGAIAITQSMGFPSGTGFIQGVTINRFKATNSSTGNTATCQFIVTVKDTIAPVAHCKAPLVISIGVDEPSDCYGGAGIPGGVAYLSAANLNNGSTDNCNDIFLTVQRVAPYTACIQSLNATNGHAPCDDVFPDFPSEFEKAISENDSIKFYCCETGVPVNVILRAYQLNADNTIAIGPNGQPISSTCQTQVTVTENIKPFCLAPANVTLNCSEFDPSLAPYGYAIGEDNCCIASITNTVNYNLFDTLCNRGTIVRTFIASDCAGNTQQCTHRIIVNYKQDFYVHFPNDVIVTNCSTQSFYGEPTYFGEDCELLAHVYTDVVNTVVPDACYKIERQWMVINWCTYNPNLGVVLVPNPNPNAIANHPSNLPGPIVSDCNATGPWASTIVKIVPTDPAATNYCTFYTPDGNGYSYKQIIKIIDVVDPVFTNCPANLGLQSDTTANDPLLWHNVFNPANPSQDLSEREMDLHIAAKDDCSGTNIDTRYLLYMDLDGNGVLETVINSANLPPADTIFYNNAANPNFAGGTPVAFDTRTVPYNQRWRFATESSVQNAERTTYIRWNTIQNPTLFVTPQLPAGQYKVKWFTTDGCGNENICETNFSILPTTVVAVEEPTADGFILYQNEPNPLSDHTNISYVLPESCEASLSVFDPEGREMYRSTKHYPGGYHTVELKDLKKGVSGVCYYRLQTERHSAVKKMLIIR